MVKMMCIDLDGTLLNSEGKVSTVNKEAIQLAVEKGVEVVIATGRSFTSAAEIVKELGISGYIICLNGALLMHTNKSTPIESFSIQDEVVSLSYGLAATEDVRFYLNTASRTYTYLPETTKDLIQEFQQGNPAIVKVETESELITIINSNRQFFKLAMTSPVRSTLERLQRKFESEGQSIVFSDTHYIELMAEGISKGHTVKLLAEKLGFSLDEIACFGDNENDIEMLQLVKYGVAMGNAPSKVKLSTKYTTDSNDQNGVAKGIHTLLKSSV